jgi:alcohol dehydrogenase YqhD (iron-dependent ADH family)
MPSSLLLNSELFSSYKNHVTLKALVGIVPSGAITFISQLYAGSISDCEIVIRSGFLSQAFDDGDSVMADKGFQIQDILPLGVSLNIPPFLGGDSQMSAEDVIKTHQIASLRIYVERAINKIKNFHIWDSVIPLSMFGVVNQMWSVCAFLCNTH